MAENLNLVCPHCGKDSFKDRRGFEGHKRFCSQNPDRVIPDREAIQQPDDPRVNSPSGIEELGSITSLLGENKPSSEISKDIQLSELKSREFANSLSLQAARNFVAAVKKDELLKNIGAPAALQNDGKEKGFLSEIADDIGKIFRDNLKMQVAAHQLRQAGLLPSDGAKKDDSAISLRELMVMERMDRMREKGDQSKEISQLQREKDRSEAESALKLLGLKIDQLSATATSRKDIIKQVEEIKTISNALGLGAKKEEEDLATTASRLITSITDSPGVSEGILKPIGSALADRVRGPVQYYQPPENELAPPEGQIPTGEAMQGQPAPPGPKTIKIPSYVPGEYENVTEEEARKRGFLS